MDLLTSPRVVSWILERITGTGDQQLDGRRRDGGGGGSGGGVRWGLGGLTVSLDLEDVDPHVGDETSRGAEGRPTLVEAVGGIGASMFVLCKKAGRSLWMAQEMLRAEKLGWLAGKGVVRIAKEE